MIPPDPPQDHSPSDQPDKRITELENKLIDLEAQLLRQEHRLIPLVTNFLFKRKEYDSKDPRWRATLDAIIWRVLSSRTAATASIGIVSIVGLLLAYKANELINVQNKKIDLQTQLSEAQRRSALLFELTSINDKITELTERGDSIKLSSHLIGRIQALSTSFRPYKFLDEPILNPLGIYDVYSMEPHINQLKEPKLIEKPLSPERGQILITLLNSNLINLNDIIKSVNFSTCDLRGTNLQDRNLDESVMPYSDLSRSNLYFTSFKGSILDNANFSYSYCAETDFSGFAQKEGGVISEYGGAHLMGADFTEAYVSHTNFSQANLSFAKFKHAIIGNNNFKNANLYKTDFTDAIVGDSLWLGKVEAESVTFGSKTFNPKSWKIVKQKIHSHTFKLIFNKKNVSGGSDSSDINQSAEVWLVKPANSTIQNK